MEKKLLVIVALLVGIYACDNSKKIISQNMISIEDTTVIASLKINADSTILELIEGAETSKLNRITSADGNKTWIQNNGSKVVKNIEGSWVVIKNDNLAYTEPNIGEKYITIFADSIGREFAATFYTTKPYMVLTIDGNPTFLARYKTASGFAYSNDKYDFYGKGQYATLDIEKGKASVDLIDLIEKRKRDIELIKK